MADEMGRKVASDLLTDVPERVYPVGRLDRNSEGLLIFTNDGEFANDIMHPSKHVPKTYRVTIDGMVNEDQLSRLMSGVAVGLDVGRLRRIAIGGVKLGMLKPGAYRDLTKDELRSLRASVGKGQNRRGK